MMLVSFQSISRSEWSHYAERKGLTIFVGQNNSLNPKCKGLKQSSEQKFTLGKWHYVRELCYSINSKGDLVFSDPSSINPFGNFTLKSENFLYIPTVAEKDAAAEKNRINNLIESINRDNKERQRRSQNFNQQDGMTQMIINGEPVLCMRIGAILNCD